MPTPTTARSHASGTARVVIAILLLSLPQMKLARCAQSLPIDPSVLDALHHFPDRHASSSPMHVRRVNPISQQSQHCYPGIVPWWTDRRVRDARPCGSRCGAASKNACHTNEFARSADLAANPAAAVAARRGPARGKGGARRVPRGFSARYAVDDPAGGTWGLLADSKRPASGHSYGVMKN